MRIHGVQAQGLRIPSGGTDTQEHECLDGESCSRLPMGSLRIDLGPGYEVVTAAGQAGVLTDLLLAGLYPQLELSRLLVEHPVGAAAPARAVMGVSLGADAFQIVMDLRLAQLALMRTLPETKRAIPVAKGAQAVHDELFKRGLPSHGDFELLHCIGTLPPALRHAATEPEQASRAALNTPLPHLSASGSDDALPAGPIREAREPTSLELASEDDPELDLERVKQLQDARDQLGRVEAQLARAMDELEARPLVASIENGFEGKLAAYRSQVRLRDTALSEVERARRMLLDQRVRLRSVPGNERGGMALGVGLIVASAVAAQMVGPVLYSLSAGGVVMVALFAGLSRVARARLGRLEARLSGLRVRERTAQQRFEREAQPVLQLQQTLAVDSVEALQRAVADFRGWRERATRLRAELDEAQRAFGVREERELAQLEGLLRDLMSSTRPPQPAPSGRGTSATDGSESSEARPAGEAEGERSPEAMAAVPAAVPPCPDDPDRLVHAAQTESGLAASEIRARMAPGLQIYLRALSEGRLTDARRGVDRKWQVHRADPAGFVSLSELDLADIPCVSIAFRLAILEGLASSIRTPLIVGPHLELDSASARLALGRALGRLGGVLQVIHIASAAREWEAHAHQIHRPLASNAAR